MSEKKTAIVLYLTRYTDKTSIIHLYTRDYGRLSCLANGLFFQKSKLKRSFIYPLSVLNVVLVEKGNLFRMKDAELAFQQQELFDDPIKRCMAMFLAEVLTRSLREADPDEALFDFLIYTIENLSVGPCIPDFHLYFLLGMSSYLGFEPNVEGDGDAFDLENGIRCHPDPTNMYILDKQLSDLFFQLCKKEHVVMAHLDRQRLLDAVLLYYKLHLPSFGNVRSLDVLRELFV